MLNIIFRVDGSSYVGSGHLMRCLFMANYFKKKGANIIFISVESDMLKLVNYRLYKIKRRDKSWLGNKWKDDCCDTIDILNKLRLCELQPDILIIDQYKIDDKWENMIRPYVKKIMVIDDLEDRKHNCDILLDQNLNLTSKSYKKLVPEHCKLLLGGEYIILNKYFLETKKKIKTKVQRVCIFFGSIDNNNITGFVLKNIKNKFDNITFDIIIGPGNKNIISNKYLSHK